MQVKDPVTSEVFPVRSYTPSYAPPELSAFTDAVIRPEHDLFSLAILVCQLLMDGQHPFEGVPCEASPFDDLGIADNVLHQRDRIAHPERLRPMTGMVPTELLPDEVRRLAITCFDDGHGDPERRPSAHQWWEVLKRVGERYLHSSIGEIRSSDGFT